MKKLMLLFVGIAFVGFLSANNLNDDPPAKAEQKTTQVEKKSSDCKTVKSCCEKKTTEADCGTKKSTTAQAEPKKEEKK